MTHFAIVTVIHDSAPDLERLLDSVERHLDPAPPVVVVDSGSSDGGADLARGRGAQVITLDGNRGFGAGCNAGLERVRVRGEQLVAGLFGWVNRTLESTAEPTGVPWAWRVYAQRGYLVLQAVDRSLLEPRLPPAFFYNLLVSARAPA